MLPRRINVPGCGKQYLNLLLMAALLTDVSCVSVLQSNRQKESLEAVEIACDQSNPEVVRDGWGTDLVIRTDDSLGVLVVSLGGDKKPDRPIEEYWNPRVCGMTSAIERDIVCVNGRMRQWPEFQHERVRLPFDCGIEKAPDPSAEG